MKKIEKLTPEQEKILPKFHEEWFRWGTCTSRADRPKAEKAILAMRKEIKVNKKPIFIWCDSPATSLFALEVIKSKEWADLTKKISGKAIKLESSLESSLGSSLRSSLESSLADCWWGQHESYWVAFYLFCRDVVGVKYEKEKSKQLDMWRDVAQSCCWWWCYENYVVISERPTIVNMDANCRVHSEMGPSIAFADGWEVYSWHGTTIPKEWIDNKDKLDPQTAINWQNIEQRRCAAEIIGWAKVLKALNPKTIDKDPDPEIGELLEVDLPNSPKSRFLKVRCGTGREMVLCVPREMKTALQANAATYNIDTDILKKMKIRT